MRIPWGGLADRKLSDEGAPNPRAGEARRRTGIGVTEGEGRGREWEGAGER